MGLQWGMWVSDGSLMKHVEVSDQACQSLKKHIQVFVPSFMSVSDGSPIRHVGLGWVFDQACRSPN